METKFRFCQIPVFSNYTVEREYFLYIQICDFGNIIHVSYQLREVREECDK